MKKLEELRKEKQKNDEICPPPLPKRKLSPNFPERLLNYKKLSEKKKEMMKIERLEAESALIKAPNICKKSKEIFNNVHMKGNVQQRLENKAKEYKEKQESHLANERISAKLKSVPSISPLASKIKRSGDVATRLASYKHIYNSHLQELQSFYNKTPEKPQLRSSSVSRKRLLKPKSQYLPTCSFSFTPALCEKTRKLAKNMGKSYERLLKTPSPCTILSEDPECFFVPEINSISTIIARKNQEGNVWDNLYALRGSNTCRNFDNEDMSECTFHPIIYEKNNNPDVGRFIERVNGWNKEKEEKLLWKKNQEEKEALKNCTFSPEIKRLEVKYKEEVWRERKECLGYSKRKGMIEAYKVIKELQKVKSMTQR